MVQKEYNKLHEEFGILPTYNEANTEFEISSIENTDFLLRKIKRKMGEKIEQILELFEHILSPDPSSISDIYESNAFTTGEKEKIVDLHRKLMMHYRIILETDLLSNTEEDVKAIRKIFDAWSEHKKQVQTIAKKLRNSWEKKVEPKEVLEYLG